MASGEQTNILLSELQSFNANNDINFANLKDLNEVLKKSSIYSYRTDSEQLLHKEISSAFSHLLIKCMEPDLLEKEENIFVAVLFQVLTLLLRLKTKCLPEQSPVTGAAYTKMYNCIVNSALQACMFWENEGDIVQTEFCLSLAEEFHIKIKESIGCKEMVSKDKTQMQTHQFLIFAHQIHLQDSFEKTFQAFEKAKAIAQFPNQSEYLCHLAYNSAIKSFKIKCNQECVLWLRQSFELGKDINLPKEKQISILELLANSYLNWNSKEHWAKAAQAFQLAFSLTGQSHYLVQRIQAVLHSGQSEKIKEVLWETPVIFTFPDRSLKEIASSLLSVNQFELAVAFASELCNKNSRWLPLKLKTLIHVRDFNSVKTTCQQFLQNIESFEKHDILDTCFNLVQAREELLGDATDQAIEWIILCLQLLEAASLDKARNLQVTLKRQLCVLYLKIGQPQKAREILKELMREDKSLSTFALNIKVALILGEKNEILKTINNLGPQVNSDVIEKDTETITKESCMLLAFTCGLAVKHKIGCIARASLKKLLATSTDPLLRVKCLQTLLKDICQQVIQESSKEREVLAEVEECLEMGFEELLNLKKAMVNPTEEAVWFMKLCWNLSIKLKESSKMFPLLKRSCAFLTLTDPHIDPSVCIRRKTCLLMVIACGLQGLRTNQVTDKEAMLKEIKNGIHECKKCLTEGQASENDSTNKLLVLYEFEVICREKNTHAIESVYEQALLLSDTDAKYLELLITIAQESGLWCAKIIIRLTKAAIAKHMASSTPDLHQVARNLCIMTQVVFETEDLTSLDPYSCINGSLEILVLEPECQLPETELAWLVVKLWNYGIQQHNFGRTEQCERWWKLARRLLTHNRVIRDAYQNITDKHLQELFPSPIPTVILE